MKTGTIVVLGIVFVFVLLVMGVSCSAFSYRQDCIESEAGIKAQYDQNKNNYDNMWKKFKELTGVSKMYAKDLKELWDNTMRGRNYGGDKAVFKWIQEHNPTLDSAVYTQLSRAMEAGRNSFEADQKQLVSKREEYEKLYKGTASLFFNPLFGFPRIDLSKYTIVTSEKTENVFDSKRDNEALFE